MRRCHRRAWRAAARLSAQQRKGEVASQALSEARPLEPLAMLWIRLAYAHG